MLGNGKKYIVKINIPFSITGTLLEGICVNQKEGCISWVDIEEKKIFYSENNLENIKVFDYESTPSNIFFVSKEMAIILDDNGISNFYWEKGKSESVVNLSRILADSGYRGNDGIMLGDGDYLFGSMSKKAPEVYPGCIWHYTKHELKKIQDCHIPNLFVKLNNKILIADSHKKFIYEYSETGDYKGLWSDWSKLDGTPDGGCVSIDNNIYVASWGSGEIIKLNTDGKRIASIKLPMIQPTNCKIYRNSLIVSSAKVGLSKRQLKEYPTSGKIVITEVF